MSHPRIPKDSFGDFKAFSDPFTSEPGGTIRSSSFPSQGTPATATPQLSPFDLAKTTTKQVQSPQALLAQLQMAESTMATIQGQLNHPKLKMSSSQKHLVKGKLLAASSKLQAVNQRIGSPFENGDQGAEDSPTKKQQAELQEEMQQAARETTGPLMQFFNYVSDGMYQLESAKRQIGELSKKGSDLNAADFLFVQLKVTKAQQELEFTSALLAKSVEGFKMIMNVQL